ncbi:hypothetical protein F511_22319 [Dorcoceras hygrometricum]|uniref:Uncharacterized protein n=1 Tax=Dorcoceras hygrometricum TaxID=472368 RepID=A0A2Z7C6V5_9LAMI|nr:hypothetical protein F511_22319 [Dorcoceras hygrometricum]
MKYEFRLLNVILANSVTVKAGSFDAVTHERFLLMKAIHFGLKINWSKFLFDILKEMVTKYSKQSKGFAARICVLLKSAPNLTLGEAKTFPPQKILTVKTVGTYVAKNTNIGSDEDEPEEQVSKKAATKRRPTPAVVEPAAKKKRTTVGRVAPAKKGLAMVPVVQNPEPIYVVPAATLKAPRRRAPKRKLVRQEGSDDEIVDNIIHQAIAQTAMIETRKPDLEEPVVVETTETGAVETKNRIDFSSITNYDEEPMVAIEKEEEKESEKEKEIEPVAIEGMKFLVQLREKVINEIVSLFSSFSLCRLAALGPLSDIAAKEEQILAWDETDLLHTAVSRRLYIISKYSEMLLRKFLEVRNKNFESGTPTTAIDLQILDMLSDAYRDALEELLELMIKHKLEWSRPINSKLFEGDHRDRGAVIARSNKNIRCISYIRFLVLIDGSWTAIEGPDMWYFQTLTSQSSEIIAYINRGDDAKKGEISKGPQPPPNNISRPEMEVADLVVVAVGANLGEKEAVVLIEEIEIKRKFWNNGRAPPRMAAPHRVHVCAWDCALAAQWPASSGRDMQLLRVSDCALAAVIFTPGCATRWPLSREASHSRWLLIARRLHAWWRAGCQPLAHWLRMLLAAGRATLPAAVRRAWRDVVRQPHVQIVARWSVVVRHGWTRIARLRRAYRVIPRGSWVMLLNALTMIRWASPEL